MPILILSVIVQVLFVLHILKTGRNTTWIWVVVMLPAAGSIAYAIMEILPEFMGSRSGHQANKKLQDVINPNKDIKQASKDYTISDSVENTMKLANELLEKGMYEDATTKYKKCLSGMYKHDAHIMFGLAQAEYGLQNYSETKQTLDDLIQYNPDFKNATAHLLYAKTLAHLGKVDSAIKEYEALHESYSGPEATYRYAMLLQDQGENEAAKELLEKIISIAKVSDKHYKSRYKEWINKAKQA
ncbi:MAG TPA: tetratricopeptide repeat protein [Leucothrix mucor]|nr:tetratricopeptide repeat protein [Leucothrix mucor]